jgi:hypothetical protein
MSFLLVVATALLFNAARGATLPWRPCGNMSVSDCQSSDFAYLPSNGVGADAPLSSTGTWGVSGNTLIESSRQSSTLGSADCTNQLGVIRYVPTIANLSELYHIRVKVRVNGTAAAGIVFGDSASSYSRLQFNTNASCPWSAQVVFRTAFSGQPGNFSQLVKLGGSAARNSTWYELRMRLSFSNQQSSRLDAQIIDQSPPPGAVSSGPSVTLDNPSLTIGTKIGLWCSSASGCEFRDYVIVKDSLRGQLTGQLDCQACNLQWTDGSADWCRCCQQDCSPFQRSGCVAKGLCTTMCTSTSYCPVTTSAFTTTNTPTTTTTTTTAPTTTTTTTTTTAPTTTTTRPPTNSTATTSPPTNSTATTTTTTTTTTTAHPQNATTTTTTTTATATTTSTGPSTTTTRANTTVTQQGNSTTTTTYVVPTNGTGSTTISTTSQVPSNATSTSTTATSTVVGDTTVAESTTTGSDGASSTESGGATDSGAGSDTTAESTGEIGVTSAGVNNQDSVAGSGAMTVSVLAAAAAVATSCGAL